VAGSKSRMQELLPITLSAPNVMHAVEVSVPFAESGTCTSTPLSQVRQFPFASAPRSGSRCY
jgi:hypothetical protein